MNLLLMAALLLWLFTVKMPAPPRIWRSSWRPQQAGNANQPYAKKYLGNTWFCVKIKWFMIIFLLCVLCRPRPYLYKSDHQYPGVNGTDLPVAVLYAEIGTKDFNAFHKVLSERAQEGKLVYVLRHFVSVSISSVISSWFNVLYSLWNY